MLVPLLLSAVAAAAAAPAPEPSIVVTAARMPVAADEAPASVTVLHREQVDAVGLPLAADLLRLAPGVSLAISGPRGSQTQLRIRGAEANHTLLFVDGIRFNDPAAGNEARFELLAADPAARIELVRGPQSALWGSEALGGVVAIDGADPRAERGFAGLAEYGGLDSARASARFAAHGSIAGISGSAGWIRSDGIDSFGRGGERDGFENRHASVNLRVAAAQGLRLGAAAHWIEGESAFDGFDPVTFRRADTLDATANRIGAARLWAEGERAGWSLLVDASILASANRNRLGTTPLNRTSGERRTAGAQLSRALGGHRLTAALEHETEEFRARDQSFFGATDQDRARRLTAVVGQWQARWSDAFSTDLAVRHDRFSAFADATTLRAAAVFRPTPSWRLHAAYGEGIAQPTFYDLYGFFPGSFRGNPALTPERSTGWEAGLRWKSGRVEAGLTGFSSRLENEIVDTFDPATFSASTANADASSRRRGVELEFSHRPTSRTSVAFNYTLLDAEERQTAGTAAVREVRRARHSFNLVAAGSSGRFGWGASAAYVGRRRDMDFDLFPARTVVLGDYLLTSLRVAWRVADGAEAFVRAENALAARYQDVVGYNNPGRTVHAGIRLRLGD